MIYITKVGLGIAAVFLLFRLSPNQASSDHVISRCDKFGSTSVVCHDQCDFENNRCWQKTLIDKCACNGFVSKLAEIGIFHLNGARISAEGFGFINECQSCARRCSNIRDLEPTRKSQSTRRRYVMEERKTNECQNSGQPHSLNLIPPTSSRQFLSGTQDPLEAVEIEPAVEVIGECSNFGDMTQLCVEHCPSNGLTCSMSVNIDACTCSGRLIKVHEVAKYDMTTKKQIFGQTAFANARHSRVCGDCVEFCEFRPGETNRYLVNTNITTCYKSL
ncbi:uncharacterized protein LOC131883651 [Tigriopus californicus]|uniref:uncharacterized protein LOC131883651 n=1 Tax=Tigriopus californicus TaxID=6832 RepID=UPI0027D9DD1E|nr:uncharacterized protein LOC131883651 [Tigriopus californicus]